EVVVLDAVADERAGERAGRLVAVGAEPLAVAALLRARVDRGQRRGDPAGLERVRRVRARADREQAELGARLDDEVADAVVLLVRAPELEAGRAGHAVAQRVDGRAADLHRAGVEELELLDRAAVELLDDRPGVRALDLEAVVLARDRVAVRPRRRAPVDGDGEVRSEEHTSEL